MKTEKLYDGITGIRDDIVEKAENYAFWKRSRGYGSFVMRGTMAACACLMLLAALPHLAGRGSSSENGDYVTNGAQEAAVADKVEAPAQMAEGAQEEISPESAAGEVNYTGMLPAVMLEGYELEGEAAVYEGVVLQAKYYNEELQDEMIIRIAYRDWFVEEMGEVEVNTVLYREKLETTGSYIYVECGEFIAEYSFRTRDIAEIEDFYDMVYSAPFFEE